MATNIQAKQRLQAAKSQADLIKWYTDRLEKVKGMHLSGKKEGSWGWEKGMGYVKFAEAQLEAVKNGQDPNKVSTDSL